MNTAAGVSCWVYLGSIVVSMALSTHAGAGEFTPWSTTADTKWVTSIPRHLYEEFVLRLDLTEDERLIADQLYEEHLTTFAAFVSENRPIERELDAQCKALAIGSPARAIATIEREKRLAPVADKQVDLDDTFLRDLKVVLIDEQREDQWATQIRFLNRVRWLRMGSRLSHESVDLVAIIEGLEIRRGATSDPDLLAQLLTEYAIVLDQALSKRMAHDRDWSRHRWRLHQEGVEAMANPIEMFDEEGRFVDVIIENEAYIKKTLKQRRDQNANRQRIARINRQYRARFAAVLPDEAQLDFRREYESARTRWTARPLTYAGYRYLTDAINLDSLVDEQIDALENLRQMNLHKLPSMASRVMDLVDRENLTRMEMGVTREQSNLRMLQSRAAQLDLEETKLRNAMRTIDNRLIEQVFLLLTPAQQALLVKPEAMELD